MFFYINDLILFTRTEKLSTMYLKILAAIRSSSPNDSLQLLSTILLHFVLNVFLTIVLFQRLWLAIFPQNLIRDTQSTRSERRYTKLNLKVDILRFATDADRMCLIDFIKITTKLDHRFWEICSKIGIGRNVRRRSIYETYLRQPYLEKTKFLEMEK